MVQYGSWRSVPLPPNWPAIRADIMARDPICLWGFLPGEDGPCAMPSEDVDHMGDPDDHSYELLRGICRAHHRRRTASQGVAGRAMIRASRPRLRPKPKHPGYKRKGDD
jgi:5-methylcytosine-specific restriction enzyme A